MLKYGLLIIGLVTFTVLGFYVFGYEPTNLELSNCEHSFNNEMNQLNQTGKTEPSATVTINGEPVIVDKDGNFYKIINVTNGQNIINITSKAPFKASVSTIALVKRTEEKNHVNIYYQINNTITKP